MIKALKTFFNWLKVAIAKETFATLFGLIAALILAWATHKILKQKIVGNMKGASSEDLNHELFQILKIDEVRYWVYIIVFYMLIIYGLRLVESMIKKVLIKIDKK